MESIEIPERALVVTPHPDDAEVGCGGTIAGWVQQGTEVFYVVCTDGRAGTSDPEMNPEELVTIREKEQEEAARILGIRKVVYLRHHDGHLDESENFLGEVVGAIRRFQPDVVLTTDPHRRMGQQHRDHRAAGQVSLDASYPYARDRWHFPEQILEAGLEPHKVGAILFWGPDDPQLFVDTTDTIELKVAALRAHASQFGGRRAGGFMRQGGRTMGERSGYLYAEGFRRIAFRR